MDEQTILVVEDNAATREALQVLLELDGYQVRVAENGLRALEVLRNEGITLILADISMPVMDGYEFYQQVRSQPEWLSIPFIFLTARGERSDVFKSKDLGAEDYLVKPTTRDELLTTVRSRLERNQEVLLVQLENSYLAVLSLLANAIEQRGQNLPTHVERVVASATAIARYLEGSPVNDKALRFGSILHDIGKILIRDEILVKNTPLDENEWVELKQHTVIGVQLIENIPYLEPAIPVVRHHHERWDGTGYPDGLAGEAIPLEARIVAVADALDAMTTSHVYHQGLSLEQAYQEIVDSSGSRFDPRVVQAFQSAWTEIRAQLAAIGDSPHGSNP
jgi:putative two-component system response regulator